MTDKVKTIEVKGRSFDLTLNREGEFCTEYKGEQVSAESVKSLSSKLLLRINREQRVSIPFAYWESNSWDDKPGHIRTGAIVGIHGGNNNLLVKFDDAKTSEQFSYSNEFVEPDKGPELARLGNALNAAQKAFSDFKDEHCFNARDKVKDALGEEGAE
jgi:hypothetical protein